MADHASKSSMNEIQDEDLIRHIDGLNDGFFQWNIDEDVTNKEKFDGQYSVLRHKLVSSPIVNSIHQLEFRINKPAQGLELESSESDGFILNEKMLKDLKPIDPDSFGVDDFDDLEEEMLQFTTKGSNENVEDVEIIDIDQEEEPPNLQRILVTVQNTSIKINNVFLYEFNSTIMASSVLKGQLLEENIHDEDSLLITLTNGYFLLIKFHLIYDLIKPYVVQWWRTGSQERTLPGLSDVGREIISHSSGAAALLTSMKDMIRIHYFEQSRHGVLIDRLQNIVFDGIILKTCLVEPQRHSGNPKCFIFVMVKTSQNRFLIRLFEWSLDESKVIEHTPFLLEADFPLPILTIPLGDSVLLVNENSLVLVKINQILCANHDFLKIPYNGAFPISYFKPEEPMFSDATESEVLISTEGGIIYLVRVIDNWISLKPLLWVHKITNFILEKVTNSSTFDLLFSSDLSAGGYLRYENLKVVENPKDSSKVYTPVDKWDNWAPLFSLEVVTKNNSEEIWLGHGKALSMLKIGYSAEKMIHDSSLRRADKVFSHVVNEEQFFIFSFVDTTLVFKYEHDSLIDIADSGLELVIRTIHISSFENICFQITENSIVVSDFENEQVMKKEFINEEIILADCIKNFVALLIGNSSTSQLEVSFYQVAGEILKIGTSIKITEQVNLIKFFVSNSILYVVIGFEETVAIYEISQSQIKFLKNFEICIKDPHDLVFTDEKIYISSRIGEFAVFSFDPTSETLLNEVFNLKLTDEPIQFHLTDSYILLISKYIWKLELDQKFPVPIVIKESRNRKIYSAFALDDSKLALLRDDGFCVTLVSLNPEPVLKTVKLNQLAKRVKYLSHIKAFAIISETGLIFANKSNQLEQHIFTRKDTNSLFNKETPLCISEWILPGESKSFRNLLIGCNTESGGSLKILQAKIKPNNPDEINVFELFNLKTKGAVLSAVQFYDTIIYSSGEYLFSVSYNTQTQKLNEPKQIKRLNSLILSIDVNKDKILVSTKDYSMVTLQYKNFKFLEIENDPLIRKITNSLLLQDNITITTDKLNCSITGIQNNQNRFRANVPFVPKLQRCQCLPRWLIGDTKNNKQDSLIRFIAYGLSGDLQLFTLMDKEQTSQHGHFYKRTDDSKVSQVTEKGFWEIKDGPWSNDRNINTFDHDRFDMSKVTKNLETLINSVSI